MMCSSDSDRDEPVATATASCPSSPAAQAQQQPPSTPPQPPRRRRHQRARRRANRRARNAVEEQQQEQPAEVEAEDVWRGLQLQRQQREASSWPRRASRPVVVAGEAEGGSPDAALSREGSGMGRARSLTDDDLEELKGCVDLGFGFSYHEIPELCGTLPALELCYSMSQRFLDEHQQLGKPEEAPTPALAPASPAQPVATNWKISSPGDSPDEVKARLKYWAQAVACTVRLCS
ncbi:uncharacterized protein C2845_PM17G06680 [Panicum miliaceum]|uniref:Uncharacterized protein n=1 Tax=Panicum miliaceum TaxID=4540 RepID=A0A3L6Q083_PANMI|nr:uncharacterized protein C2845_PM17G06680 [Panicum miliaceum]